MEKPVAPDVAMLLGPPPRETRVRRSYGDNFERLAAIKKKYDPRNTFRFNQNIPPAK